MWLENWLTWCGGVGVMDSKCFSVRERLAPDVDVLHS